MSPVKAKSIHLIEASEDQGMLALLLVHLESESKADGTKGGGTSLTEEEYASLQKSRLNDLKHGGVTVKEVRERLLGRK